MSFPAIIGDTYRIEVADDLAAPTWSLLQEFAPATTNLLEFLDPMNDAQSQKFLRGQMGALRTNRGLRIVRFDGAMRFPVSGRSGGIPEVTILARSPPRPSSRVSAPGPKLWIHLEWHGRHSSLP